MIAFKGSPIIFRYEEFESAEPALDHYLKVAKHFHSNNLYENSIAKKVDDLVLKLFAEERPKNDEGELCPRPFIAIPAPRFIGKTQLPFLMKHKALYFNIFETKTQDIYLNYKSLNDTIIKYAE